MLKKSRNIAVLSVCIMMFAAVQPAFAWDLEGAFKGGVVGAVLGAAAVVVTGGAALPLIVGGTAVGAAIGGAEEKDIEEAGRAAVITDAMKPQPQY